VTARPWQFGHRFVPAMPLCELRAQRHGRCRRRESPVSRITSFDERMKASAMSLGLRLRLVVFQRDEDSFDQKS